MPQGLEKQNNKCQQNSPGCLPASHAVLSVQGRSLPSCPSLLEPQQVTPSPAQDREEPEVKGVFSEAAR